MNRFALKCFTFALFALLPAYPQSALNLYPSRVVGQLQLAIKSNSPNLVEGRELWSPWAVALDTSASPNILYVSDTANNRVLGFRNASSFSNGQPADFVVGQIDKLSTLAQSAATGRQSGLNIPGGLAVDRAGNLYVVDTGNNRIVRFPKPASLSDDDVRTPDFVIGQTNTSGNAGNALGAPTANSIFTGTSSSAGRTGLAFDPQGNLWFTDALNHRVLRYPATVLVSGAPSGPAADVVLGQPNFTTAVAPAANAASRLLKGVLRNPGGIAIDPDGRVYVSDDLARVVVFTGPFSNGKEASRLLGISVVPAGRPVEPNDFTIGSAEGLFTIGNRLGVVDTGFHRVLIYDPFTTFPDETAAVPSPAAKVVLGQGSFTSIKVNRGNAEASADSLSSPLGAVSNGQEIFVADSGNNRIVVYTTAANGASATRVLGQTSLTNNAPNLVEGRELFLFNPGGGELAQAGAIVIDNASTPPRMYISDSFNNRVLGFADARKVRPGDRADVVIGQTDFSRTVANTPSGPNAPTETGLFRPIGLAVDKNGDLFVADAGNGRVLRFPAPFSVSAGLVQRPNLVLGQANLTTKVTDPTSRTMSYPYGLGLTVEGHVVVSDFGHNRVLFFRRPSGDFVNGMAAERVLGQPDFFSSSRNSSTTAGMSGPSGLALDTDDRLYLADSLNNRVLVFDRVTVTGNNAPPAFALTGLTTPQGVWANPRTGEIWVSDFRGNRAQRYPRFELFAITTQPDYSVPSNGPMALTQDSFGNLYIAEALNRIAIFYNGLAAVNAATSFSRPISPGQITTLYQAKGSSSPFSTATAGSSTLPLPKQLADVQVLLNDKAVPLYYVSPTQINLLVPNSAPESGQLEFQVVQASTGQVVATSLVEAQRYSPGLFITGGLQQGQIAALNEDFSVNTSSNRIQRGKIVQIFGTGQGRVPNAPEDGAAPSGQTATADRPRIIVGSDFVDDADVLYSGLAPGFPGLWQINFRVPIKTAPSDAVDVVVQIGSQNSNGAGFLPGNGRLRTTIAVSQ